VVEANQAIRHGRVREGRHAAALDGYAQRYDWQSRLPKTLLDLNRFTTDGASFGSGSLYGISQNGEIIGIYVNKQKLSQLGIQAPATWADFEAALPRSRTPARCDRVRNKDQWPAIHEFGVLQGQLAARTRYATSYSVRPRDVEPAEPAGPRRCCRRGPAAATSPGTNGLGYDQAAAQSARTGSPDHRHWKLPTCRSRWATTSLHAAPGASRRLARHHRRRGAGLVGHRQVQAHRVPPPTSTSSPTRTPPTS